MRFQNLPINSLYYPGPYTNPLKENIILAFVGEDVKKGDLLYYDDNLKKYMKALSSDPNKMPCRAIAVNDIAANSDGELYLYFRNYKKTSLIEQMTQQNMLDINGQIAYATSTLLTSNKYVPNIFFDKSPSALRIGSTSYAIRELMYISIKLPTPRIFKKFRMYTPTIGSTFGLYEFSIKGREKDSDKYVFLGDITTSTYADDGHYECDLMNDLNLEFEEICVYNISAKEYIKNIFFYDENDNDILPVWDSIIPPEGYSVNAYPDYIHDDDTLNYWNILSKTDKSNGSRNRQYCWLIDRYEGHSPFLELYIDSKISPKSYSVILHPDVNTFNKWRLWASEDNGINWELLDDVSTDQKYVPFNSGFNYYKLKYSTVRYNRFRLRRYCSSEGGEGDHFTDLDFYDDVIVPFENKKITNYIQNMNYTPLIYYYDELKKEFFMQRMRFPIYRDGEFNGIGNFSLLNTHHHTSHFDHMSNGDNYVAWTELAYCNIIMQTPKIVKKISIQLSHLSYQLRRFSVKGKIKNGKWILLYSSYPDNYYTDPYTTDDVFRAEHRSAKLSYDIDWISSNEIKYFELNNPDNLEFEELQLYDMSLYAINKIELYDENDISFLPSWSSIIPPKGFSAEFYPNSYDNAWYCLNKESRYSSNGWDASNIIGSIHKSPFLDIMFNKPFKPHSFTVTNTNSYIVMFNKWRVFASDDHGINWDLIYDVNSDVVIPLHSSKTFIFKNIKKEYNRFRFRRYNPYEHGSGSSLGYIEINVEECYNEDITPYYTYQELGNSSTINTHTNIRKEFNIDLGFKFFKNSSYIKLSSITNYNSIGIKSFRNNSFATPGNINLNGTLTYNELCYMWIKMPKSAIFKRMSFQSRGVNAWSEGIKGFSVKGKIKGTDKFYRLYTEVPFNDFMSNDNIEYTPWIDLEVRYYEFNNPDNLEFDEIWIYDISMISMKRVTFYDENDNKILPNWISAEAPSGYEYEIFPTHNNNEWLFLSEAEYNSSQGWVIGNTTTMENYKVFVDYQMNIRMRIYKYFLCSPNIQKWKIFASPDNGVNWELISHISDSNYYNSDVNNYRFVRMINVESENIYNRVRLEITDDNIHTSRNIHLSEFTIYGILNSLYVSDTIPGELMQFNELKETSQIQKIGHGSLYHDYETINTNNNHMLSLRMDFDVSNPKIIDITEEPKDDCE